MALDTDIFGGEFAVFQGEDRAILFSPPTDTSISGQTFEVRIVDLSGLTSDVVIAHGSLTISAAVGDITATLTSAITAALNAGSYHVELWRTDSGNKGKLAFLTIMVK